MFIMTGTVKNPLLGDAGLHECLALTPNQILHWLKVIVDEAEAAVTIAVSPKTSATYLAMVTPLEDVHDRLGQAWGRVLHLNRVISAPKWRQVVKRGNGLVIGHWTKYKQNTELCNKYEYLKRSGEYRRLNTAQRRVVDLSIRDFRRNGAHLPVAKKRRAAKLSLSLSSLSKDFSNRLIDAAATTKITATKAAEISGIPADLVRIALKRARRAGHAGWEFTLQGYEPMILLQAAENRAFRRRIHSALISQASDLGPVKYDTTKIIFRILTKRQELARLLDYQTFADSSLSV
jgi:oligopeptidase A